MITKITKMVPRIYYVIDGVEFCAGDILELLDKIDCGEGDDVEYYLYECADKLVELGYLNKRYGMRQHTVYEDTEDTKASKLFHEILHMQR